MVFNNFLNYIYIYPSNITLIKLFIYSRISLLESLIGLFELPEDTSTGDDEHFIDVEDTPGKT